MNVKVNKIESVLISSFGSYLCTEEVTVVVALCTLYNLVPLKKIDLYHKINHRLLSTSEVDLKKENHKASLWNSCSKDMLPISFHKNILWILITSLQSIPYRARTGFALCTNSHRKKPVFITGNPCSHCRDPVFITGKSL